MAQGERQVFERNKIDSVEQGLLSVELTLADGRVLAGRVALPVARGLADFLNGGAAFLEFTPFEGERTFIAKSTLAAVRPLDVARPTGLVQRTRDMDEFDPRGVLGVSPETPFEEVRQAFLKQAKVYHPDRYSNVELPVEVAAYLAAMARRINAAYAALEQPHVARKQAAALRQEPVYTSATRR